MAFGVEPTALMWWYVYVCVCVFVMSGTVLCYLRSTSSLRTKRYWIKATENSQQSMLLLPRYAHTQEHHRSMSDEVMYSTTIINCDDLLLCVGFVDWDLFNKYSIFNFLKFRNPSLRHTIQKIEMMNDRYQASLQVDQILSIDVSWAHAACWNFLSKVT